MSYSTNYIGRRAIFYSETKMECTLGDITFRNYNSKLFVLLKTGTICTIVSQRFEEHNCVGVIVELENDECSGLIYIPSNQFRYPFFKWV